MNGWLYGGGVNKEYVLLLPPQNNMQWYFAEGFNHNYVPVRTKTVYGASDPEHAVPGSATSRTATYYTAERVGE